MGGVPCRRCVELVARTRPSTRVGRKSVAVSRDADGCSRHTAQPNGAFSEDGIIWILWYFVGVAGLVDRRGVCNGQTLAGEGGCWKAVGIARGGGA